MASTIKEVAQTVGQKFLATRYPVVEGLVAAETKQTGIPDLIAEEEGVV